MNTQAPRAPAMRCRHCGTPLDLPFLDLGTAPPSNAYLSPAALNAPERWYPLRLLVCQQCWLVQTQDFAQADELFDPDYAYFSAYSSTWLAQAQRYVHDMTARFGLGPHSRVVEVAANDGYLLQYVQAAGIPCYGIEPTASTAAAARARGIAIEQRFFGRALAQALAMQDRQADLMVANNVLAHVPDINDFVAGFALLLKPRGVVTFEFPHLLQLVRQCQFDTVYHEHYSYLSLGTVQTILAANGLRVFDVAELPTHGGSLRVFAQRADTGVQPETPALAALLAREREAGMQTADFYKDFQRQANRIKRELLSFLINCAEQGKTVAAYGAAAKGNTLLNFAGVRPDLLPFVVDKNPAKQGQYMPGSRIPILAPEHLLAQKPDDVLILPWNLRDEVMAEWGEAVRSWGGRFVVAVPALHAL
ncbi:MAG: methyltransferase C-terminal domain-containing protein [Rhodoferax sp.]